MLGWRKVVLWVKHYVVDGILCLGKGAWGEEGMGREVKWDVWKE
jgi:hypothetical protein